MKLINLGLGSLALMTMTGTAFAWDCANEKEITKSLSMAGTDLLQITAYAGELEIRGREGLAEARVTGTACASKEEWLEDIDVLMSGGSTAAITAEIPNVSGGMSWSGNKYAYLDLVIEVPADLPLDVKDSSGDLEIRDTAGVRVEDSSGDIEISGVNGEVELEDSSGDIELDRITGEVIVRHDSSGDIRGRNVDGNVLVAKDSSGDISFRDVTGDYLVERDSSGDIVADTVGGDFTVLRDGSGSIRHSDVSGSVTVPKKG